LPFALVIVCQAKKEQVEKREKVVFREKREGRGFESCESICLSAKGGEKDPSKQ
jgi:hypothetical protein